MPDFERPQVATLVGRLLEPPDRLIAVFGPRQSGKTTAARQALAQVSQMHRYEAIDEPEDPRTSSPDAVSTSQVRLPDDRRDTKWLVETWTDCREVAKARGGFVLVLDEIQKVQGWSETGKGLWDADRANDLPMHVVILGSAPLLMQAGLTESLAGRFELVRFTHWSYSEMADAFGLSLEQYIYFGGYPRAAHYIHDPERWSAYIQEALVAPNIERDVLSMTRVDKPALLKRLFEVTVRYSGQILSYNKMIGQLQDAGNTTTVARYLDLLGQAGLVTGLPKHTERPVSAKASTPKLNVLNTALISAVSRYTLEEARADRTFWGRLTESAVGAHLINTASPRTAVKYWRDKHGNEVDFVLQRGPNIVGVEVKSGQDSPSDSALSAFEKQFQPQATIIVGEAGIPLHEFLSEPADHWFEAT